MDPFSMSNPSFFEGGGGRHYYYFLLVFRGTEKQLIHFPFPIHLFSRVRLVFKCSPRGASQQEGKELWAFPF